MRRCLVLSLLLLLVAVSTACQVRADVAIDVEPDGSGVVEVRVSLDAEAARRLGDPLDALRLDDLRFAGWEVDEPSPDEGGGLVIVGRRGFSGADQLGAVLAEVGGVDGVFTDVDLELADGFGRTDYEFAATVSLTGNPEEFADEALTATLDGLPLARTPEELAAAGALDPEAIRLGVSVALPGGVDRTNGSIHSGRATWSFPVTGGEPTSEELTAGSTVEQPRTRWLVGVAVVAAVAAAVTALVGLLRRRT